MTTAQLAWVAGLLEGEGCFGLYHHQDRQRSYATVKMSSTDEDVARRVKTVTGMGHVSGPYFQVNRLGKKPQWRWQVQTHDEALYLMDQLYPYMGERRQQKIDEVLTESGWLSK